MAGNRVHFQFSAYGENGKREAGTIEAISEADAVRQLARSGRIPFEIRQVAGERTGAARPFSWRGLFEPKLDLTRFFSDLSVMLNSGFNIDIALQAAADAETSRPRKARIAAIHSRISEGKSVAEAFASQPEIPPDVAALVSSGESSGRMDTVFSELAKNYALRAARRTEITEALLYPAFLIVVMFGALMILSLYLVPAIQPIFENGGVETPIIVSTLAGLGAFFSRYGLILLSAIFLMVIVAIPFLRTPATRKRLANVATRVPVAGAVLKVLTRARYLHVMALLLANGVPLLEAMGLAANAAPAESLRARLTSARQGVSGGEPLWKALQGTGVFTDALLSLVRLGEESNNLAPIMARAATMTDAQLQRMISRFLTFLTPAITIIMGIMVGTLVISVMTTLLSINEIAIR